MQGTPWRRVVARDARRAVAPPAAALLLAGALVFAAQLLAPRLDARPAAASAGRAGPGGARANRAVDPLARVRVIVTPPAYAREPARTLDAPPVVAALVGSTLVVQGDGRRRRRVRATLVAADSAAPRASRIAA